MVATTSILRVSIPISGTSSPKQSPFASDKPMRNPVYEPGPMLTATASIFIPRGVAYCIISSINPLNNKAWLRPS